MISEKAIRQAVTLAGPLYLNQDQLYHYYVAQHENTLANDSKKWYHGTYHLMLSSLVDVVWRTDQKYCSMKKCGITMYELLSLFVRIADDLEMSMI